MACKTNKIRDTGLIYLFSISFTLCSASVFICEIIFGILFNLKVRGATKDSPNLKPLSKTK